MDEDALDWELDRLRTGQAAAARRAEQAASEELRRSTDLASVLHAVGEAGVSVILGTVDGRRRPAVIVGVGADVVTTTRPDGATVYLPLAGIAYLEVDRSVRNEPAQRGSTTFLDVVELLATERADVTVELADGAVVSGAVDGCSAELLWLSTTGEPRRTTYLRLPSIVAAVAAW